MHIENGALQVGQVTAPPTQYRGVGSHFPDFSSTQIVSEEVHVSNGTIVDAWAPWGRGFFGGESWTFKAPHWDALPLMGNRTAEPRPGGARTSSGGFFSLCFMLHAVASHARSDSARMDQRECSGEHMYLVTVAQ